MRKSAPPIATLGDLHRHEPRWMWLWCPKCHHHVAAPIAPFVIRFGPHTGSDVLRRNGRCRACGHHGALIQMPSHHSMEMPYQPFPVEQGMAAAKLL